MYVRTHARKYAVSETVCKTGQYSGMVPPVKDHGQNEQTTKQKKRDPNRIKTTSSENTHKTTSGENRKKILHS